MTHPLQRAEAPRAPASRRSQKGETRGLAGGAGFEEQDQTLNVEPDCASADVRRKRFETLRAALALAGGHVVRELDTGGFLVCWHSLSRHFADLDDLERHARRVGAVPPRTTPSAMACPTTAIVTGGGRGIHAEGKA